MLASGRAIECPLSERWTILLSENAPYIDLHATPLATPP
jgi:hypothetical protein